MNLIKKIILTSIFAIWITWFWFTVDFYYDIDASTDVEEQTEIGGMIQQDVIDNDESALNRLLELFHLSDQDWYDSGTSKAVYYAKMIVNMLLSLVSLIALIMLIYAFYLILFSRHESWMTKAKQMLKGIWLAIAIMWLSWLIVSFMFWIQRWSGDYSGWAVIATPVSSTPATTSAVPITPY